MVVWTRRRINNIAKQNDFSNIGASKMEIGLFGGRGDGEHNGVRFMEVSNLVVVQDNFVLDQHHVTNMIPQSNMNSKYTDGAREFSLRKQDM